MMDYRALRIVFMGTPDFAVASLNALLQAGCNIVGVVTAPDKPAGRGMQLQQSAVKKFAVEHQLQVLQPEKLKNPGFLAELKALQADLHIVVAFRMLPEVVWNMPPMGSINLHGSLLPEYRGAAPINWAVINGEKETGVTTFKLKHVIDTGDILLQESFAIGEDETAGEVHDRMKMIGAQLLVKTVQELADGSLQPVPQEELNRESLAVKGKSSAVNPPEPSTINHQPSTFNHPISHAPKIFTETCRMDAAKSVAEVHNLIRGLSPFPGAFTSLQGKMLKVYRSSRNAIAPSTAETRLGDPAAGQPCFFTDQKSYLHLQCADGRLALLELQLEGKKRMPVAEFLRGFRFADQ